MRKTYLLVCIVAVLALLCVFSAAARSAAGSVSVSPDRFLCHILQSDNADFFEREDGSLLVTFRNGAPVIEAGDMKPAVGGNAIRIVLKNNSTCNQMMLQYTAQEEKRELRIPIARRGEKQSYYFYPESLTDLTEVSLSFSGAYNGSLELYSISATSIYDDSKEEPGSILDCTYSPDTESVHISGTVNHEIAVNIRNATVELYAFGMNVDVADLRIGQATPIASAPLSVRFEFDVPAQFFEDRFLQYVVTIKRPDGRMLYSYTPRYPCVKTDDALTVPEKGVYTEHSVLANRSDAGLAIVDVYLDRLPSPQKNGILHIVNGKYFYLDRSYINELDGAVKQYSANGGTVYLRFLQSSSASSGAVLSNVSDSSDAVYYGIWAGSDVSRRALFAYTSFLCDRYSGNSYGTVGGIVVGRSVDHAERYNYVGDCPADEYVSIYAKSLYIISEAAKEFGRSMDIVVPVSSLCDDGSTPVDREPGYTPELFLTSLCKWMSHRYGNGFSARVLVETDRLPAALTGDQADSGEISPDNIEPMDILLEVLQEKYGRLATRYLYYWAPEPVLNGEVLINAYAYTYYKLLSGSAAGVILSTEHLSPTLSAGLLETVKYIDTQVGFNKNAPVLKAFDVASWEELIPQLDSAKIIKRNVFVYENGRNPADDLRGKYVMWDHQQGRSLHDWYESHGTILSVADKGALGRVLVADFKPEALNCGVGEIIYAYSADEIMSVVDMLSVDLTALGEAGRQYTVILEVCGDKSACEVRATVESGISTMVYLNTLKLDKTDPIRNIRIFSAPTEGDEPYSLCIRQLVAHSNTLDSEALEQAVIKARLSAMQGGSLESKENPASAQAVFLLLAMLLSVSAVILVALAKRPQEQ